MRFWLFQRCCGAGILGVEDDFQVANSKGFSHWEPQNAIWTFSGNAFKNGILTVALPQAQIDRLLEVAETDEIAIDLEHCTVTTPFQDRFTFDIDPFRRHCLLEGLDEVGLTMERQDAISAYEAKAAGDLSFLSGPREVAA